MVSPFDLFLHLRLSLLASSVRSSTLNRMLTKIWKLRIFEFGFRSCWLQLVLGAAVGNERLVELACIGLDFEAIHTFKLLLLLYRFHQNWSTLGCHAAPEAIKALTETDPAPDTKSRLRNIRTQIEAQRLKVSYILSATAQTRNSSIAEPQSNAGTKSTPYGHSQAVLLDGASKDQNPAGSWCITTGFGQLDWFALFGHIDFHIMGCTPDWNCSSSFIIWSGAQIDSEQDMQDLGWLDCAWRFGFAKDWRSGRMKLSFGSARSISWSKAHIVPCFVRCFGFDQADGDRCSYFRKFTYKIKWRKNFLFVLKKSD